MLDSLQKVIVPQYVPFKELINGLNMCLHVYKVTKEVLGLLQHISHV